MNQTHRRTVRLAAWMPLLLIATSALACDSKSSSKSSSKDNETEEDDAPKKKKKKDTEVASASGSAAVSAKPEVSSVTAPAPPQPSPTMIASVESTPTATPMPEGFPRRNDGAFPDTETKPPTVQEWDEEAQIIRVKHSSSLNCETKTLREWVRVSCRGRDGGISPMTVEASRKPLRGQFFTFARAAEVASLVVQPRKGQRSLYDFNWSNWGRRQLSVEWPAGNDRPTLAFDRGAPTSKAGQPRCQDVCDMGGGFRQPKGDCAGGCGSAAYGCEWLKDGPKKTAFCFCKNVCSDD